MQSSSRPRAEPSPLRLARRPRRGRSPWLTPELESRWLTAGGVFQEFQQLDSGLGRQAQGTGLGLALTRRYAALHGGDVRCESEVGKGSVFTLSLPSGRRLTGSTAHPGPKEAEPNSRPLILVVEDDPAAAELIRNIVERGGYRTEIARDGNEAPAKARDPLP